MKTAQPSELHGRMPDDARAFAELVTADRQMLTIFAYIKAIAGTGRIVTITGETGTGKELIARAVHQASGRRGSFRAVNLAGLDDAMISDTLFGHARGAFTGADRQRPGLIEEAADGTLFLDEIGDLSARSQVRLLRLLDTGEYYPLGASSAKRSYARLVAAANRDLEAEVAEGRFRQDLYYRLKVHRIHLPPLRDRRCDVPLLVEHFVSQAARELGIPMPAIPGELYLLLDGYPFPGNVRELRAMLFDAVTDRGRQVLNLAAVRAAVGCLRAPDTPAEAPAGTQEGFRFPLRLPTIREMTRLLVEEALRRAEGNQSAASRLLGISQQALSRRLARNGGNQSSPGRRGRKRS